MSMHYKCYINNEAGRSKLLFLWHKPKRKFLARIISLVLTASFVFPYLTWAFTPEAPVFGRSVIFQQKIVDIPAVLGTVTEAFQGQEQLVVCVQNLHCNYEVQKNISGLIQSLAETHGLKMIAIEGASSPLNVRKLSTFPSAAVKEEICDHFMKQGQLTGMEYYAATGKHPAFLEGIESPELYAANLAAVKSFLSDEAQGCVCDLREALQALKPRIYSSALLSLDEQKQAFRAGRLMLLQYASFLHRQAAERQMDPGAYPGLENYISSPDRNCLDMDRLLAELGHLDGQLRQKLYTLPGQSELDGLEHRLDIMEKLLAISATPEDLAEYRARPQDFVVAPFVSFLGRYDQDGSQAIIEDLSALDKFVAQAGDFYRVADARSQAFVDNTLKRMQSRNAPISLLVTGGYHTQDMLAALRQRNISYLCVKPRLPHPDLANPYFSLLRGRLMPLERLLAQNQNILEIQRPFAAEGEPPSQFSAEAKAFGNAADVLFKLAVAAHALAQGKLPQAVSADLEALAANYPWNNPKIFLQQIRPTKTAWLLSLSAGVTGIYSRLGLRLQTPDQGVEIIRLKVGTLPVMATAAAERLATASGAGLISEVTQASARVLDPWLAALARKPFFLALAVCLVPGVAALPDHNNHVPDSFAAFKDIILGRNLDLQEVVFIQTLYGFLLGLTLGLAAVLAHAFGLPVGSLFAAQDFMGSVRLVLGLAFTLSLSGFMSYYTLHRQSLPGPGELVRSSFQDLAGPARFPHLWSLPLFLAAVRPQPKNPGPAEIMIAGGPGIATEDSDEGSEISAQELKNAGVTHVLFDLDRDKSRSFDVRSRQMFNLMAAGIVPVLLYDPKGEQESYWMKHFSRQNEGEGIWSGYRFQNKQDKNVSLPETMPVAGIIAARLNQQLRSVSDSILPFRHLQLAVDASQAGQTTAGRTHDQATILYISPEASPLQVYEALHHYCHQTIFARDPNDQNAPEVYRYYRWLYDLGVRTPGIKRTIIPFLHSPSLSVRWMALLSLEYWGITGQDVPLLRELTQKSFENDFPASVADRGGPVPASANVFSDRILFRHFKNYAADMLRLAEATAAVEDQQLRRGQNLVAEIRPCWQKRLVPENLPFRAVREEFLLTGKQGRPVAEVWYDAADERFRLEILQPLALRDYILQGGHAPAVEDRLSLHMQELWDRHVRNVYSSQDLVNRIRLGQERFKLALPAGQEGEIVRKFVMGLGDELPLNIEFADENLAADILLEHQNDLYKTFSEPILVPTDTHFRLETLAVLATKTQQEHFWLAVVDDQGNEIGRFVTGKRPSKLGPLTLAPALRASRRETSRGMKKPSWWQPLLDEQGNEIGRILAAGHPSQTGAGPALARKVSLYPIARCNPLARLPGIPLKTDARTLAGLAADDTIIVTSDTWYRFDRRFLPFAFRMNFTGCSNIYTDLWMGTLQDMFPGMQPEQEAGLAAQLSALVPARKNQKELDAALRRPFDASQPVRMLAAFAPAKAQSSNRPAGPVSSEPGAELSRPAADQRPSASLLWVKNVGLGSMLAVGSGLVSLFIQQSDVTVFAGLLAGVLGAVVTHELAHKRWMPGSRIDWRNLQVVPAERPLTQQQSLAGPLGSLVIGLMAAAGLSLILPSAALGLLLSFVCINALAFVFGDAEMIWRTPPQAGVLLTGLWSWAGREGFYIYRSGRQVIVKALTAAGVYVSLYGALARDTSAGTDLGYWLQLVPEWLWAAGLFYPFKFAFMRLLRDAKPLHVHLAALFTLAVFLMLGYYYNWFWMTLSLIVAFFAAIFTDEKENLLAKIAASLKPDQALSAAEIQRLFPKASPRLLAQALETADRDFNQGELKHRIGVKQINAETQYYHLDQWLVSRLNQPGSQRLKEMRQFLTELEPLAEDKDNSAEWSERLDAFESVLGRRAGQSADLTKFLRLPKYQRDDLLALYLVLDAEAQGLAPAAVGPAKIHLQTLLLTEENYSNYFDEIRADLLAPLLIGQPEKLENWNNRFEARLAEAVDEANESSDSSMPPGGIFGLAPVIGWGLIAFIGTRLLSIGVHGQETSQSLQVASVSFHPLLAAGLVLAGLAVYLLRPQPGKTLKAPGSLSLDQDPAAVDYIEKMIANARPTDVPALLQSAVKDIFKNLGDLSPPDFNRIRLHTLDLPGHYGLPRFDSAVLPQDLVYAYAQKNNQGNLDIFMTQAFFSQWSSDPSLAAEILGHEWDEHMNGLTHAEAAKKARRFARAGALSPFHVFYLSQLRGNPAGADFARQIAQHKRKGVDFYELLFKKELEALSNQVPSKPVVFDVIAQRVTTEKGFNTGEVSLENAISAGANGIFAGHADVRANFERESDAKINQQIQAAHAQGLKSIALFVGGHLTDKGIGNARDRLKNQVLSGLDGLGPEQVARTIIAYQPFLTSDTKQPDTPEDMQNTLAFIRNVIHEKYGVEAAQRIRLVLDNCDDAAQAESYLRQPDIDGLFISQAGTLIQPFRHIVGIASRIGPKQGRIPYICANWKTFNLVEGYAAFAGVLDSVETDKVQVGIAPSLAALPVLAAIASGEAYESTLSVGSKIKTGIIAQRISGDAENNTGEVSPEEVVRAGATGIFAGHADARMNLRGESDEKINHQLRAAFAAGLYENSLIVGDTLQEYTSGQSKTVIKQRVLKGLDGLKAKQVADMIIAYEPIRSLETDNPVPAREAQEMAAFIRSLVKEKYGQDTANKIRIGYGNFVDKANARSYLSQPDIDVLFIGVASTSIAEFLPIVKIGEEIGPKQGRVPYIGANWKTMDVHDDEEAFVEALKDVDSNQVQVGIAPSLAAISKLKQAMIKASYKENSLRKLLFAPFFILNLPYVIIHEGFHVLAGLFTFEAPDRFSVLPKIHISKEQQGYNLVIRLGGQIHYQSIPVWKLLVIPLAGYIGELFLFYLVMLCLGVFTHPWFTHWVAPWFSSDQLFYLGILGLLSTASHLIGYYFSYRKHSDIMSDRQLFIFAVKSIWQDLISKYRATPKAKTMKASGSLGLDQEPAAADHKEGSDRGASLLWGKNVALGSALAVGSGLLSLLAQHADATIFAGMLLGILGTVVSHELSHKLLMPGSRIDWKNLQVVPAKGRPLARQQSLAGPLGSLFIGLMSAAGLSLILPSAALGLLLPFVCINALAFVFGDAETIWRAPLPAAAPLTMVSRPVSSVPLRALLGNVGPNESWSEQHILAKTIARYGDSILGSGFDRFDHIRIRLGSAFQVDFEEWQPGAVPLHRELQDQDAALVITLPRFLSGVLQAKPESGFRSRFLYGLQEFVAGWALAWKLRAYADQTRSLAHGEALENETVLQDFAGKQILRLDMNGLLRLGGSSASRDFYRPQAGGNRRIGITLTEVAKVMETYRLSLDPKAQTLWSVIEGSLQALLADGEVPSAATLVQALLRTPLSSVSDPLLRQTVDHLQRNLRALEQEASSSKNDERLRLEVSHAVELIIRSRQGLLPDAALPVRAMPDAEIPQAPDQIRLLLDASALPAVQKMASELAAAAPMGSAAQADLEILRTILSGTAAPQDQARFLRCLQSLALPAGRLAAMTVGEDGTAKYAGALVNGRAEAVKFRLAGREYEVAKPVVASVLASTPQAIQDLNSKASQPRALSVLPYLGQLPANLRPSGDWAGQVGRYLDPCSAFRGRLSSGQALAQAYYRWQQQPSDRNNQALARVVLRIMKHAAQNLQSDSSRKIDFDQAMTAVNELFGNSPLFRRVEIGRIDAEPVYAPASLSRGGQLAYIWLCQQRSGDFIINDDLENALRLQRLRNFRINSAA